MDTKNLNSGEDEFQVLDLIAMYAFKTEASISFHLGAYLDELLLSDESIADFRSFDVRGRVDVHHPCRDHIKTRLVCTLPAEYHVWDKQKAIIDAVLAALKIPADETFEATFFSAGSEASIEQAVDHDGLTDRMH